MFPTAARGVAALCLALCALALAGCDPQTIMKPFIPEKEEAIGKSYVEDIRLHNFAPVKAAIDPQYRDSGLDAKLEAMAGAFPSGAPKSVKTIGSNTASFNSETTYNFTFEYEFPQRWVLGHVYFRKAGNALIIERMDVIPVRDSLEHQNAFTLAGKTPLHYAFLVLAIFLPVFTIGTAIVCGRTRGLKRKWLWIIFILLAAPTVVLNWTTGAVNFNLFQFLLAGAGFVSAPYGAVTIQIGFPLGAILFWIRRRTWKAEQEAADIREATRPFT